MQHVGISPGRQKCSQLAETSLANSKEASTATKVAAKNFIFKDDLRSQVYDILELQSEVPFYPSLEYAVKSKEREEL